MANGDDAAAAGMDVLDGNEDRREGYDEINKTRDYIAQRTSTVTPIAKGGTGETNAAAALSALGGVPSTDVYAPGDSVANKIPRYDGSGRLIAATPTATNHATSKSYVDAAISGRFPAAGGTFPGDLGVVGTLTVLDDIMVPNATAAVSGWTVAYIDATGRLSRGSSSRRYKKYITGIDPADLGDIWPEFVRYQMKGGDGSWQYGYIAEQLDESDDLRPFVVYQTTTEHDADTDTYRTRFVADEAGNPVPESIDFIALIMAQNAQLKALVDDLDERVRALGG